MDGARREAHLDPVRRVPPTRGIATSMDVFDTSVDVCYDGRRKTLLKEVKACGNPGGGKKRSSRSWSLIQSLHRLLRA